MFLYAEELYDALSVYCNTAWNPQIIHYGIPRIEVSVYPHCVIRLAGVPCELIMAGYEQLYTFEIIYRGEWDTSPTFNVELAKVARVNEFVSKLSTQTTLATYGHPEITDIDFTETDDPNEPFYEVVITVNVTVHAMYGD